MRRMTRTGRPGKSEIRERAGMVYRLRVAAEGQKDRSPEQWEDEENIITLDAHA